MSEAAVERTVKIGLIAYRGPDGAVRRAQNGATVLVHPDHVERFDRLNVLPSAPEPSIDHTLGDADQGENEGDSGDDGDAAGDAVPPPKQSRTSRAKAPAGDKE